MTKFILIIWTAYSCCTSFNVEFDTKVACEQAKSSILGDLERSRFLRIELAKSYNAAGNDREMLVNYPLSRGECFPKS